MKINIQYSIYLAINTILTYLNILLLYYIICYNYYSLNTVKITTFLIIEINPLKIQYSTNTMSIVVVLVPVVLYRSSSSNSTISTSGISSTSIIIIILKK